MVREEVEIVTVDILVVTYNACDALERCIRSIQRNTSPEMYRLTVVDNASSDGTRALLKRLGSEVNAVFAEANLGFSKGANLAASLSRSEWVVFLDDDVEVTPGWLDGLVAHTEKEDGLGIVTCKVLYPNGSIFSAGYFPKQTISIGHGELDHGQHNVLRYCDAFPGPVWLVSRKVFRRVGGFEEAYFPCQYEDVDFCLKVREAGLPILYDGSHSVVHHNLYRSGGQLALNRERFQSRWSEKLQRYPFIDTSAPIRAAAYGYEALNEGRGSLAVAYFLEAKRLDPGLVGPFHLACALEMAGRKWEAFSEFKRVLDYYHPHSWRTRAQHWERVCSALKTLQLELGVEGLDPLPQWPSVEGEFAEIK